MEQSASTLKIMGYVDEDMLSGWSIRIHDISEVSHLSATVVKPFFLNTEVYTEAGESGPGCFDIELAIPACLLAGKPAQLLNVLIGELPRLGFLTSFRVIDMKMSAGFGSGPSFGRTGILKLLNKQFD